MFPAFNYLDVTLFSLGGYFLDLVVLIAAETAAQGITPCCKNSVPISIFSSWEGMIRCWKG